MGWRPDHLFQNSFLFAVFRVGPRILNFSQIPYQVVLRYYSWDTVEQLTQITETKPRVKHGLSCPPNDRNRRRRHNLEARYAYHPFGRELIYFPNPALVGVFCHQFAPVNHLSIAFILKGLVSMPLPVLLVCSNVWLTKLGKLEIPCPKMEGAFVFLGGGPEMWGLWDHFSWHRMGKSYFLFPSYDPDHGFPAFALWRPAHLLRMLLHTLPCSALTLAPGSDFCYCCYGVCCHLRSERDSVEVPYFFFFLHILLQKLSDTFRII